MLMKITHGPNSVYLHKVERTNEDDPNAERISFGDLDELVRSNPVIWGDRIAEANYLGYKAGEYRD